jgi:hypothetical protein
MAAAADIMSIATDRLTVPSVDASHPVMQVRGDAGHIPWQDVLPYEDKSASLNFPTWPSLAGQVQDSLGKSPRRDPPTWGSVLRLQAGSTVGVLAVYEAATPARAHFVAHAIPVEK